MKRILIIVAALIFALTGAFAQDKTTLTFLYYIDASQAGYDVDQAIWAKFVKDNPDINLVKEELFNEPFHQKVAAYIASGNLPDVQFMWPSGRSTELHRQGLMKDLQPLLGADFLKNFAAAAANPANQFSGYLAMLPQSVTYTNAVYVNKKLLASLGIAVPKTYADMKAMVPKLKAKGLATVLMANKDTWVMQSCLFSTIAGRMAGDSFIDDVKAGKVKFTDATWINALKVVENLYKDGIISRDTIQIGYNEGPGLFAAGKAAIYIDGDWRQGAFLTDATSGVALIDPKKQATDFTIMNFPAIPGEKNPGVTSAIVGVGLGIAKSIPAGSAKEKAAVRLLKYYYSPEVLKQRLETGAFIPSRTDVKSSKLEPFTVMMAMYYASVKKTCYVLDGVLDASVFTPLNDGLQALGSGTTTVDKIAADMQKAMDAWIAANK